MSDVIKLNIKSKKIKAVVSDIGEQSDGFKELPEIIEHEKQELAHKIELENEFKRGYDKGKEDSQKELEQLHSEELLNQSKDFYKILSTFEEKIKIFENQFNQLVISVSEKIANKIIKKEFELNSDIIKILDENLRKIIGANDIIVKLHPNDFELIQKSSREFMGSSGITKINFEPNENIDIGGCLVESEIGNLDARVGTQVGELIKALENEFTSIDTE